MKALAAVALALGVFALGLALPAGSAQAFDDAHHRHGDDVDFAALLAPSLGSEDDHGCWLTTDWYAGMVGFDDPVVRTRYDRGWRGETGLTRAAVGQVFVGDVSASARGGVLLHQIDGSFDDPTDPLASFSATAIANASDIALCDGEVCGEPGEDVAATSNDAPASPSIDFAQMMAPSLGSGAGPMTAYILLDLIVAHDVRTAQVLVGHVDAYAAVDSVIAGPAVDPPEPGDVVPEVKVAATAVGNVGTLESDVGVRGDGVQVVVGAVLPPEQTVVDEPAVQVALDITGEDVDPLSGVLLGLVSIEQVEKAQITAEASVGSLTGVFADVSATALANLHTTHIDVSDLGAISAIDIDQLAHADTSAIVHLEEIALEHAAGLRVAATALGNIRNVVVSMADGIETGF